MRTRKSAAAEKIPSSGKLADESHEAVDKLLRRVNKRGSAGIKKNKNNPQCPEPSGQPESGSSRNDEQDVDLRANSVILEAEGCSRDAEEATLMEDKVNEGNSNQAISDDRDEMNDSDWEDGSIPVFGSAENQEVTIELNETPDSVKRKPVRRATAEEKEVAEMVHKVHLLCLLGRGRLIDRACDDPLIQAALLSLLPKKLLNVSKVAKLTAKDLHPLMLWFQDNFHIRRPTDEKRSFRSALAVALESREGTSDEIAALSVALFRALNLPTRFVSILDVASLKPDGDKSDYPSPLASRSIFSTLTPMVSRQSEVFASPVKTVSPNKRDNTGETSQRTSSRNKDSRRTKKKDLSAVSESKDKQSCLLASEASHDSSEASVAQKSEGPKRKGDVEFELQMEMALSSTAIQSIKSSDSNPGLTTDNSVRNLLNFSLPSKRAKRILSEDCSSSHGVSTAIGSKRVGSPLYWAEVYCNGENLTGKWVHVDAINAIIDGELKVEAIAAACKTSLRYVVAFAGNGAKDVTRRYCMKWYKIASRRVNPIWWDSVLAPLRDLESKAASGMFDLENDNVDATTNASRSSIEDMELETRALTEPLPTNQQAYKNHQLYAIEKWLTKYQILHPKGPVLGFCNGHSVYPRACVQTLKTKERWLREALQVKPNELPVKEMKHPTKHQKNKSFEDDDTALNNSEATIELYGRWQLEPLQLPRAVNGIVPKNERGQVDVWSEKCLPPGTVHLRLPRVFYIAKTLGIDYAPAMVGFEFKNGQSYPVFEGIVVCAEFKDIILEAYIQEQKRREAEEKRKNENEAISRWYQLLSSIVTRQMIKNRYGDGSSSVSSIGNSSNYNAAAAHVIADRDDEKGSDSRKENRSAEDSSNVPLSMEIEEEHVHVFVTEDRCFDDEKFVPTKRCYCGLIVQAEDL